MKNNGAGFRSCARRTAVQYVGHLAQGAPQLLDRLDDKGNMVPGRMHIPPLVELFGEDSFNYPCTAPWAHILASGTGDTAAGLRQASSQITQNFEEVAIDGMYDPEKCLVLQDVSRIGFNHDGTRPASVTNALTAQWELMEFRWWMRRVRSMPISCFDRWAFENCDVFSQQVMLAAPNAMGHMDNEAFVLAVLRYLGQSSYITKSMEGLYFGKKDEQVNPSVTNLCCALLGGSFRVLHDQVKTLIITCSFSTSRGRG